jgi:hypothetical protein
LKFAFEQTAENNQTWKDSVDGKHVEEKKAKNISLYNTALRGAITLTESEKAVEENSEPQSSTLVL